MESGIVTALIENYKDFIGDGSKDSQGRTLEEFLLAYDAEKYKTPAVTADIVVIKEGRTLDSNLGLKLLMIRRKNHPCINEWALPGGFAEEGETLLESARRELQEETGVTRAPMEQLHTWSQPNRDPRGWVITTSFLAYLENNVQVMAGDDAKEADWFEIGVELLSCESYTKNHQKRRERGYKITLQQPKRNIRLSADVEISENLNSVIKNKQYIAADNDGIAFDHCKIIIQALEQLEVI